MDKKAKPSFEDQESSYMISRKPEDSQKPNMEVFERYQREVQIEKRLINKVSEDRELSDLILNLHQYKKLYRELKHEKIIEKEDFIGKLRLIQIVHQPPNYEHYITLFNFRA